MLYTTTRGKHDVVTAYKAIHNDCHTDGGLFVPFRMPQFSKEKLDSFAANSPVQTIADVLNEFFAGGLSARDVENALGRRPIKTATIGRSLNTAELWHNVGADVNWTVQRLSDRMRGISKRTAPSNWMHIAVRVALLTAAYSQLLSGGGICKGQILDVAVTSGDFAMPMAAWYARQIGLPIGTIVCGCNANGGVWDLINRGEFATGDLLTHTCTPLVDIVVPRNLERLICGLFGVEETARYLLCCAKGKHYILSEDAADRVGQGMFAAVISDSRVESIIPGFWNTNGHVLSPYAALAYGSLQDYWSMTGCTRAALLVEERSPKLEASQISALLHMNESDLRKVID